MSAPSDVFDPAAAASLLASYSAPAGCYDELKGPDGVVRAAWQPILDAFARMTPDERQIAAWREAYGQDDRVTLYKPRGCTSCAGTGYKGRIGLFELLPASDEVKRMIIEAAPAADLFELALEQGMTTLKHDGIDKILQGVTDLSQVLAVSRR